MIGRKLSHYRIVERIGAGGMGTVYLARDERLERDVALKVLPETAVADDATRRRLRHEALALSRLNHPHIETIHDFDTEEGVDFLVVEHVPGVSLAEKLTAGPLPEAEIVDMAVQIAGAMQEAHEHQVIHRDLKPANLVVTPSGQVKVLDFGIAKLLLPPGAAAASSDMTATGQTPGTLPYMAPEQLLGTEVDARTDLYALGVVLYEMATGKPPFTEKLSAAMIADILHRAPVPPRRVNPTLSTALEAIILTCLEKDPTRRYPSAREMLAELRRLATGGASMQPRLGYRLRRRRGLVAALVVGLLALVLLLAWGPPDWRARLTGGVAPIRSLAVLPLANLSGNPAEEFFVDGMTDELIGELAGIGALRVISRTSAMHYKGVRRPLQEIARELDVDAVVEGSALRSADRVRIAARLIDVRSGRHVWSGSYERDVSDVLGLQSEVARSIAGEIRIRVTPEERVGLAGPPPVNTEAYQHYLQGRYHWNKRTDEGMRHAIDDFERALAADPGYARAYAGLADAYALYGGLPQAEVVSRAKAAAHRALALDSTLAESHATLGLVAWYYEWDWAAAERGFARAIELNPNYATAHHWLGLYHSTRGRHDRAIAGLQRARDLDPLSLTINTGLAQVHYFARRYDQAIAQSRRTLELEPGFANAHFMMATAFEQTGSLDQAAAELRIVLGLSEGQTDLIAMVFLARIDAEAGRTAAAMEVLKRLGANGGAPGLPRYYLALLCAALRRTDQAFEWLERAFSERESYLVWLEVDPRVDSLRGDPRLADLARRVRQGARSPSATTPS